MKKSSKFRPITGILLLDKPTGLSSNTALQVVRRLFCAEKGGHTGSLDPLATGLLPICLGEATKIAGLLLGSNKAYVADIILGITTDTDDSDGELLQQRPVPTISKEEIIALLQPFIGTISQRAPIYSALKQGGEPLYAKARRGETIEAPVRQVTVHDIEYIDYVDNQLTLKVTCGSGTYIRSLARDLGEVLGCGAHISGLRRLWVEPFIEPQLYSLEFLRDELETHGLEAIERYLLPIEKGLQGFHQLVLPDHELQRLRMGQRLFSPEYPSGILGIYNQQQQALGLVNGENGVLIPQRMFNV